MSAERSLEKTVYNLAFKAKIFYEACPDLTISFNPNKSKLIHFNSIKGTRVIEIASFKFLARIINASITLQGRNSCQSGTNVVKLMSNLQSGQAVLFDKSNIIKKFIICSDSKSTLTLVKNKDPYNMHDFEIYVILNVPLLEECHLIWVSGYCLNEIADIHTLAAQFDSAILSINYPLSINARLFIRFILSWRLRVKYSTESWAFTLMITFT